MTLISPEKSRTRQIRTREDKDEGGKVEEEEGMREEAEGEKDGKIGAEREDA
jgi:hypothetical protein